METNVELKMSHHAISITLVLLMCAMSLSASETDVAAIARATDEHYNHLKSSKADFTQKYEGPGMSRTESGTLWLKKPGRMRWEYRQPAQKLFLTDAHTAWFYVSGERQAKKASLKNVDDIRSPLRYLLGKTRLEKELMGLSLAPDVAPINASASLHLGLATSNFAIQEYMGYDPLVSEVFQSSFRFEDGYLRLEGRLKEMILRGGENISPYEIEEVLLAHPAVTDAVCFGVADEKYGERVGAAVQLAGDADERALADWCRERLAAFKVPEVIHLLEAIPRTPTGKVQRKRIAEQLVR